MHACQTVCIAVASVHGEVRCNFFSGCAVRTALTPAPFPPRAALSSLELFLCKGLTYLERISCRVSQGFVRVLVGCGLQPLIPFFSSCMTLLLTSPSFSFLLFPSRYWNSGSTSLRAGECGLRPCS